MVSAAHCRLCAGTNLKTIYRVPSIPVHSCVLLSSVEDAAQFPRRDLELAACYDCGFVFNRVFDEEVMGYSTNFEESQHFSETFNRFAKELAQDIATKLSTAGKRVLEIGCGKGEFLLELCAAGNCRGLGIDPGYRNDRIQGDPRVEFMQDFFGPSHYNEEADIILCRHTLEHIAPVMEFVATIHGMVQGKAEKPVVFETPDAERVLSEGAFWDIYYEHCSYFTAGTHARLFRKAGFSIDELRLVYDDQYIVQTASAQATPSELTLLEHDLDKCRQLADAFPSHVRAIQDRWLETIQRRVDQGHQVVLWGGGSKAVSFLTTLGLTDQIDCVVDINPYKQGKFIPGAGHEVIAPNQLADRKPDLVIAMNPIYTSEIGKDLERLGIQADLLAV